MTYDTFGRIAFNFNFSARKAHFARIKSVVFIAEFYDFDFFRVTSQITKAIAVSGK